MNTLPMTEPANQAASGDLRHHRRVQLKLNGRFMRADRTEYTCQLSDISVGGMRVTSDSKPDIGEEVVTYLDDLGGFHGKVTRVTEDGFAMRYEFSERKRDKLAAQIMWLINRDDFPGEAQRLYKRTQSVGKRTTLKVEEGIIIDVDVIDVSSSGASIETTARPPIGHLVMVGQLEAIVRRHHPKGIGLQFIDLQSEENLKDRL